MCEVKKICILCLVMRLNCFFIFLFILVSSFVKCLFKSFVHLFIWIPAVCLFVCLFVFLLRSILFLVIAFWFLLGEILYVFLYKPFVSHMLKISLPLSVCDFLILLMFLLITHNLNFNVKFVIIFLYG